MAITDDFSLAASIWNGDKFLIEAATASGARQMKVTAEVVRAYLSGRIGTATDRRVLSFRGFIRSATILYASAAQGTLGIDVWYIQSEARFAAVPRTGAFSLPPDKLYDNWEQRADYLDGRTPLTGNLYVCADDSRPYWWTGAELRPIVTDTTGQVIADSITIDEIDAITAADTPTTQAAAQAQAVAATQAAAQAQPIPTTDGEALTQSISTTDGESPGSAVSSDPRKKTKIPLSSHPRAATVTTVSRTIAVTPITRAATVTEAIPRARVIVVG